MLLATPRGATRRARTADLLVTKQQLFQLSYDGVFPSSFVGRAGLEPATMVFCYAPAPYHQRNLYQLSYRPMVPGFRRARFIIFVRSRKRSTDRRPFSPAGTAALCDAGAPGIFCISLSRPN